MSASCTNRLFAAMALGAGYAVATAFSALAPHYFPTLALNGNLLRSWQCILAVMAIFLTRSLFDIMPRIRVVSEVRRVGT